MYTTRGKIKMQGKKPSHRNAIVKSLLSELIRNERIKTTPTKVRILKGQFDRLVNEAKKGTPASRRRVEATLPTEIVVNKLYTHILPRLQDTNSGYTISARTLPRKGDNADQEIVMIKGYEMQEKKSKLASVLKKQEKANANKPTGVTGKIKSAVSKASPKSAGKKNSSVAVRRNSM